MNWSWLLLLVVELTTAEKLTKLNMITLTRKNLSDDKLDTSREKVQEEIVYTHNYIRSHTKPKASNMLAMTWHKGAAKTAQKWADQCYGLRHGNATVDPFGNCGQNIMISTAKVKWDYAIDKWYQEVNDFTFGGNNKKTGHYTQLVWATSHYVGCGFAKCGGKYGPRGQPFYNYVCNYCPPGNVVPHVSEPYKIGPRCEECPDHCWKNHLCTNSCPYGNFWSNCDELYADFPEWLCYTDDEEGRIRKNMCRASCTCQGKIY